MQSDDEVRGDGRGWSGRGRESSGSGSIGVGEWREGWMSGMECMEINCFLGVEWYGLHGNQLFLG